MAKTGDILGNTWKLGDELGSGAMATVYRGAHRNGATAAIKVLHRTFSGEVDLCERFLSEGYLTNKVQHPGIVRVFDDGMTEDGCPFLAMDLLEGMTLEGKRQQAGGRLSLEETLKLCDGIMDVLDTVHAAGIVHRDVKTTNVFLTNDGKLKVLDFGMARSLMSRGAAKGSLLNPVVGTPSFMAPEQALGQRDLVDGQSDQWGVAAIAFLLLCGEPVHVAGSTEARLFAAASNPARSILAPLPMLDKNVAAVIDRALSYRKADRWPTMRAMRKALAQAAGAVEPEEAAPISAWQRLPRKAPRSTEVPPAPPPVAAAAPAKPAPTVAAVATKAAAPIPIAHAVEGTLPLVNRPVAPQARPAASARGPVAKNKVEGTLPLVATGGAAVLLGVAEETNELLAEPAIATEEPPPSQRQVEVVEVPSDFPLVEARGSIAPKTNKDDPQRWSLLPKDLSGTLGRVRLPTVLVMIEMERMSGRLRLRRGQEEVSVQVRGGRVFDVGPLGAEQTPRQKLSEVIEWADGTFELHADESAVTDKIGVGATALILDLAREQDESHAGSSPKAADGGPTPQAPSEGFVELFSTPPLATPANQPVAAPAPVQPRPEPAPRPVEPAARPVELAPRPAEPAPRPTEPTSRPVEPAARPVDAAPRSAQPSARPAEPAARPVEAPAPVPMHIPASALAPLPSRVQPVAQPAPFVVEPTMVAGRKPSGPSTERKLLFALIAVATFVIMVVTLSLAVRRARRADIGVPPAMAMQAALASTEADRESPWHQL